MAENRQDDLAQTKNTAGSRPSSATREDRESRIKSFKERQNEERQKKLEEMKSQALAAQRFKEQKENERRQRLDELKGREEERRQQVEERKKAINDAERDRLESILKRNQEREARIEAKRKNERSSLVFAFGSSTPRVLGPAENTSSFWGHRRATSTQNITYSATPLTRRQSERELDGGSKKRATSAGGLERSGNATPPYAAGCVSGYVGRRRTDLMPTIPTKESASGTPRKPFMRSPGRAYSMSRLDQLAKPRKKSPELPTLTETSLSPFKPLSHPQSSVSRSMSHLAVSKSGYAQQPQRPLKKSDSRSMHQLSTAAPLPPPRTTRATELRQKKLLSSVSSSNQIEGNRSPSRPSSSLSQQSTSSVTSSVVLRSRPVAAPRRQRPASIAGTGISSGDLKNAVNDLKKLEKPPLPKSSLKLSSTKSNEKISKKKSLHSSIEGSPRTIASLNATPASTTTNGSVVQSPTEEVKSIAKSSVDQSISAVAESVENVNINDENGSKIDETAPIQAETTRILDSSHISVEKEDLNVKPQEIVPAKEEQLIDLEGTANKNKENAPNKVSAPDNTVPTENLLDISNNEMDMSASFSSKPRITTEEEAKAALAERRRLAREEAERHAENERLRVEEERRLELERQQKEEEQQRQLIELQRQMEEERLREAIREAQKREEELKLKQEEEQRLKLLKEEADKKAREEAERQKAELQERLKNEEKEREARRKRVEAIMLRTRGKNNSSNTSQTEEKNAENKLDSNIINGTNKTTDMAENGHKNGKDLEMVDNIISINTIKNANTVNATTLHTEDTVNSNDAWQRNSQTDLLM